MSGARSSVRAHAPLGARGVELPVVRVVMEHTPGLGRERGRVIRTPDAAARVLAPFVAQASPTHRLAMALLDARRRLLAVAILDGDRWSACCLRPSEVYEPAIVAGATSLYLAHGHPSNRPWAGRADCASLDGLGRVGQLLGLFVHEHLVFDTCGRYASLRASHDTWSDWIHESLMHRWPLPVRGACAADDAHRSSVVPGVRARGRAARGPRFTLCGLHAHLDYDEVRLRLPRRPSVLTHKDVAPVLADCLERHRGGVVAAALDRSKRLFAVARVDGSGKGCACETVTPESIYRAAIACGARALFVAHRHATNEPGTPETALDWTARVYALGTELGLELRDHLVFDRDEGFVVSVRERRQGVADWCDGDDPTTTPSRLRLHQAMWNRRPQRPALTRARSARAALQSCGACGRRSAIKAACPWCRTPRPGVAAPIDTSHEQAA